MDQVDTRHHLNGLIKIAFRKFIRQDPHRDKGW